eukprot:TRINITY_DN55866_c0_g1_i1.p2 TRINITY_DN55866_c0_g1~~TRINITY_DN55866_c0_g1_i1.p2  ORF type:complete len:240 (-),score=52.53 TRINITY_DN55866_c0_g1_i1:38-757(-)
MLLTREIIAVPGPPPQAVLDKVGRWQLFVMLLSITCILRAISLDVAGCLLDAIMIMFAWLVLRNNMAELTRYALVYGILSLLNLIFDMLPLAFAVNGRSETEVTDFVTESPTSESYTVYSTSHSFFDPKQGIPYNAQSAAMLLSPAAMLLGAVLGISAHTEIHRHMGSSQGEMDGDTDEFGERQNVPPANPRSLQSAMIAAYGTMGQAGGARANSQNQQASRDAHSFQRFVGQAHKLDA